MPSSTGLNVHINRCMGDQFSNEQLNRSDACSTPQSRPMHNPIACRSVEISNLSTGLNDKETCAPAKICLAYCIIAYTLLVIFEIHDTLVAQPFSSTSAKFN
ncbi:hypothetical protein Dsin_025025 [Dipteronia sinensis]|uniref:Uncharacterized protein n=1 Tax=Dipteronia sinensis TaxID=43782 RepID=A0AAD9ZUT9_9ROSI|nr:hypothetical protein Dsin_025025 [Dipteronia sinensis]